MAVTVTKKKARVVSHTYQQLGNTSVEATASQR